ncbi:hypothetical protein NHF48_023110 [Sphingomonas sp. H160509]|uniref:hypothetical protein n=1 Tax=Sphingomonas sp. H160509 TaxID=2955313 RepID=UPI002097730C|nr:hypothetical protein [Sphingomonas sp. H160509]MDD1453156.1 hypothetical protein [Sphingomonas sp. H160509]
MALTDIKFGNEIFLQGKYLTLGINGSGSLGTKKIAPEGIFTDIANGFNRVGMYADFDGLGVGKPSTVTEAMLDGTPTEGFTIGYKIGGSTFIAANQERTSRVNIAGISSDRSTAGVAKAGWLGATTEKLTVDQTISLTDDGKFVRVDVVLTNNSSSAMDDLRYMRSIDPDQGSSFSTENKIVSQSGSAGALVAAYAGGVTPVFYYAQDARAVVSTTEGLSQRRSLYCGSEYCSSGDGLYAERRQRHQHRVQCRFAKCWGQDHPDLLHGCYRQSRYHDCHNKGGASEADQCGSGSGR